jgi:hypothetical protein
MFLSPSFSSLYISSSVFLFWGGNLFLYFYLISAVVIATCVIVSLLLGLIGLAAS